MKKTILLLAFVCLSFLVSCQDTTTLETTTSMQTTEQTTLTTTEDTLVNTLIEAPVISITDYELNWDEVTDISEYEVLAKDITPTSPDNLLDDQLVQVDSNTFSLANLTPNHRYEISVRSIDGVEHSDYSNILNVDYFLPSETSYELGFNLNSTNDFVLYDQVLPELFYIKQNDTLVSDDNYYLEYGYLFIDNTYLNTFTESASFDLYAAGGIITLTINYGVVDKPSILSQNSITFMGEDVVMVFDLCGGEFTELTGNDITTDDYTLTGNVLVIDHNYLQDLFDANADRNAIILSYQLRNGDQLVIGYIFINRQ